MKITAVTSGQEALTALIKAQANSLPFDLAIIDVQMPEMDGFTLVESIRNEQALQNPAIMILTSAGRLREESTKCQQLGIAAYLHKPIKQEILLNAICSIFGCQDIPHKQFKKHTSSSSLPRRTKALHILLAEDNLTNQQLVVKLLEKEGHSVVVANNGKEAVEVFENDSFDLIFMDIQMPEMDGFEATAAIREKEIDSHIPIIALTAHAMKGYREKCLAAGMDYYISKPVNINKIKDVLNSQVFLSDDN